MRILLTGGGTGGHLFPLIAVSQALRKIKIFKVQPPKEVEPLGLLFVGPDSFFGNKALKTYQIKAKFILAGKIRRYFSLANFFDILKLNLGFLQALWHLFWFMPDIVFSKGGYGSVPVVLAARVYRIPVIIHESDTIPGLANRFLAHFSKKIIISFEQTKNFFPSEKTILFGNPVRKSIFGISKEQGSAFFNFGTAKPILLLIGGSQGAKVLNELLINSVLPLLDKYQIIHQCGKNNFSEIQKQIKNTNYRLYAFLNENELAHAYAAADLIVSRAGAGSIFEVALLEKPSILIPLPGAAYEHQKANAYEYARTGATLVLEQQNLTPHLFLTEISRILDNPELIKKMTQGAKSFARPEAANQIAQEIINTITG